MGEHKTGVPERAQKRKQKKIVLSICVAVFVIVFIAGMAMLNRNDVVDDDIADDDDVTTSTEAVETTEPYVEPPEMATTSVKIGEVGDNGVANIFDEWTEQNEFHVGDVMMDGNLKIVYISSGEYAVEEGSVEDGYKVVRFEFYAENMNQTDEEISFYNFNGFADGESVIMYYAGENAISAKLSPTRCTTGYIYLKVPETAENIMLRYAETEDVQNESAVDFIYDGDKTSGYVLKDVNKSADAYNVGAVVEVGGFKISYLDCYEYVSEDEAEQPADGYRYVRCEFLIERDAESDKIDVSSWDFAVYANDVPYTVKHIGEQDINAILHGGESVQGTVTFEVPVDAEVIEAEFMYDYYRHARLIFSVDISEIADSTEFVIAE